MTPEEVAAALVRGGLTESRWLEGDIGLRHFDRHGVNPQNQLEVIQYVKMKLKET